MSIFGIGVDIVEVKRVTSLLKGNKSFLERIYSAQETAYCKTKKNDGEHFAVRFAAKEAVLKALGTGLNNGICWTDILIENDSSGAPRVALKGKASSIARKSGIQDILISLSHTRDYAVAYAVAVKSISYKRKK